jgi:NAD(P)-dependent dehydrogenase (short-subunit alcohol dehydrogenase family)
MSVRKIFFVERASAGLSSMAENDESGRVAAHRTHNAHGERPMTLHDRVVLITGGKRIGRVVAGDLARQGAHVAISYRESRREADQTAADVHAAGRKAALVRADVAVPADCDALIDSVIRELGRLDVLINMASIYESVAFDAMTERDWQRNLDVNLRSVFLCTKAAVPHMRAAGGGRVINFADWLARSGRPAYKGFVAYYTAKAAVVALTEALALELADDRILVNAIAPGPILPPPDLSAEERAEVAAATPLGRWGGEEEIVKAVRWLIESDFITGETIRVDGGRHIK